jgi:radical SAM superfamily enzyme YgiQ (UPF0313 family)
MILADVRRGIPYLRQLVRHHVSGQMKIAPEHSEPAVLKKMGKPGRDDVARFKALFEKIQKEESRKDESRKLFLTYYFIAAHPGCTAENMRSLKAFAERELRLCPEQVQVFTPAPSTYSALMYWTERDPFTGQPCFVEKSLAGKTRQKEILTRDDNPAPRRAPRKFPK